MRVLRYYGSTLFTLNIYGQIKIIIIFLLSEHLIWKKIINFLVSAYLQTQKLYQSSRVFTDIYVVTSPYIPIGVKINNLFNYVLFYQLEYMYVK